MSSIVNGLSLSKVRAFGAGFLIFSDVIMELRHDPAILVPSRQRQDPVYRESVFPSSIRARVAIEQATTFGWERYVGSDGTVVGIDTFGASAPLKDLQGRFGFTPERVVDLALERRAGV